MVATPLPLVPASGAVRLYKTTKLTDTVTDGDGLDIADRPDDLEGRWQGGSASVPSVPSTHENPQEPSDPEK
jgi:hypothetical protein